MTQGVSSPQGSWLTPDWDVAPNVHALSTLRGGGLSAQAYASFNLAQHVGDDPEATVIAVPAKKGILADCDAGGGGRDEIRA